MVLKTSLDDIIPNIIIYLKLQKLTKISEIHFSNTTRDIKITYLFLILYSAKYNLFEKNYLHNNIASRF